MSANDSRQQESPPEAKKLSFRLFLKSAQEFIAVAYAISLPISLTLSWTLFVSGLLFWALEKLADIISIQKGTQKDSTSLPPLALPLIMMALAAGLSGVFNGGSAAGQVGADSCSEAWASICNFKSVLPYFWAFRVFRRSRRCAELSVILLIAVSAIAGIWGTVQQIFNIHPGYRYLQGTGFLSHPMAFAGQMQIFSMLSFGLLLTAGQKDVNSESIDSRAVKSLIDFLCSPGIFAFLVAANFAGLFFAGERSAWIGCVAGVFAVSTFRSRRLALVSVAALSGLAGISWLFVPLVRTRIEALFSGHDTSVLVRQRIWSDCLRNYFPASPVFGIGWLKFPHYDIPEAIVPGVSKDINHAHSNYVQIITTAGMLGLASYILLVICTLRSAYLSYGKAERAGDRFGSGLASGVFGAAAALAVSGIFEYNFGTAQVRLAQWFVFALL